MNKKKSYDGYWYLAIPYSKYPKGIEESFKLASKIAAEFLRLGHCVYSPISHTHSIAVYGGFDCYDHEIWLPFDEQLMKMAKGIIVIQAEGWDESKGVLHELEYFFKAGKVIHNIHEKTDEFISSINEISDLIITMELSERLEAHKEIII